ncbi:MAG: SPOR domain-containing protein [Pseudomonadota bacterium]
MMKTTTLSMMFLGGMAVAQGADDMPAPAEIPPPIFGADQYVDSTGCAFLRVLLGNDVIWAPRFRPDGTQACGLTPSLTSQPPRTETAVATVEPSPEPPVQKPEAIAPLEPSQSVRVVQETPSPTPPLETETATSSAVPEALEPTPPTETEKAASDANQAASAALEQPQAAVSTTSGTSARAARGFDDPGFYVQAGAFGVPSNVARLSNSFTEAGWGVETRASGRLTVVYAGPFATSTEAQTALTQIRRQGMPDALILRQN